MLHAPCVGRCEAAPCAVVGQNPVGEATIEKVAQAVAKKSLACPETQYVDYQAYRKNGGYQLLAECLAGKRTRDALTKIMEDSGLRGLGGAGFPAGRKWRLVAAEPAPRLMAVNIDEGEPGTFKDRCYLERDPHRFLEGMLIAAWCAGVGEIYVYLRDEYARLPRDPRGRARESCKRSRPARCRRSTCAAARAPTSAARSRR